MRTRHNYKDPYSWASRGPEITHPSFGRPLTPTKKRGQHQTSRQAAQLIWLCKKSDCMRSTLGMLLRHRAWQTKRATVVSADTTSGAVAAILPPRRQHHRRRRRRRRRRRLLLLLSSYSTFLVILLLLLLNHHYYYYYYDDDDYYYHQYQVSLRMPLGRLRLR